MTKALHFIKFVRRFSSVLLKFISFQDCLSFLQDASFCLHSCCTSDDNVDRIDSIKSISLGKSSGVCVRIPRNSCIFVLLDRITVLVLGFDSVERFSQFIQDEWDVLNSITTATGRCCGAWTTRAGWCGCLSITR